MDIYGSENGDIVAADVQNADYENNNENTNSLKFCDIHDVIFSTT